MVPGAIALSVVVMLLFAACRNSGSDSKENAARETSSAAFALRDGMRKLWEDHITWTRLVIVSVAADLPDVGPTTDRLLQNQVDIGDAIKPYYGEQAGEQLTALLKDHIVTAADILTAAKAGDSAKVDEAKGRWYANGDDIASFLSQANAANWPLDEMKSMMRSHLDLTLKEAAARLRGDYPADIAAYDEVHQEILKMADVLSEGIVKQFPDKFAQQAGRVLGPRPEADRTASGTGTGREEGDEKHQWSPSAATVTGRPVRSSQRSPGLLRCPRLG